MPHLSMFRLPHACGLAILAITLGGCAGTRHANEPASADALRGQYALADGRQLTMAGSAHRIRAQFGGRPDTLVVPAGGAVFDAVDGSFRLRFNQLENGIVADVTLDEMPAMPGPRR
ncbi:MULTISPECIES: hypothetical protein [unclassified Massilia]|uniref:hypothetical protein n=1 Tax=unclassified Massilia TaxID=2609279 RepID=UPI0012E26DE3|nr:MULTISPECIES: hypothetical protein [unclassified Massilia]